MKPYTLILFIALQLITTRSYCQSNARQAYLITNEQDTVFGKIDNKSNKNLAKKCLFRSKQTGRKHFGPEDIIGFELKNGRHFQSATVDNSKVFLEVLISGELTAFLYADSIQRYFVAKKGGKLSELPHYRKIYIQPKEDKKETEINYDISIMDSSPYKIEQKTSGEFAIKSEAYKDTLRNFLNDTPTLEPEINRMKKLEPKPLISIAKEYHSLTSNTTDYKVHYSPRKTDFEFTTGVMRLHYGEIPDDLNNIIYSFRAHTPITNRNLYISYGFQYAPIQLRYFHDEDKEPYNFNYVIKVPIGLRYQYPGRLIKPHAAFGFNIYKINDGYRALTNANFISFYNVGVSAKVFKPIHLSASYEADFCRDEAYNNSGSANFSRALLVGILLKL